MKTQTRRVSKIEERRDYCKQSSGSARELLDLFGEVLRKGEKNISPPRNYTELRNNSYAG